MEEKVIYLYGTMIDPVIIKNRFGITIDVDIFKNVYRWVLAFTKTGKMGIAVCSPKDVFVKKTGREIAERMLNTAPVIFPMDSNKVNYDTLNELAEIMVSYKIKHKVLMNFDQAMRLADSYKK